MDKAIKILEKYWKLNADEWELLEIGTPRYANVLKENKELQKAINIIKDIIKNNEEISDINLLIQYGFQTFQIKKMLTTLTPKQILIIYDKIVAKAPNYYVRNTITHLVKNDLYPTANYVK